MGFISDRKINWIHILLNLFILCTVIYVSLLAWVPPVSRDALTHHLAVPKLYLQHGGIYEITHLNFSYYPMNLDLLYLIPLYFGNDILPKFIHLAFAAATAVLIFWYLSRRMNMAYGLFGSLFFLTIPVIVRLSSTVYVDLGLIFFLFASLLCLFLWTENGFKQRYLLLSAMLCGLALGTKYNGLIGLFLLGIFAAFVYARYKVKEKAVSLKAAGWGAAFFLIALIVFSPWMIRNFVWTGNPVYPLYNGVFNPEYSYENAELNAGDQKKPHISHIQFRRQVYNESWLEIALIPLRVFFQGEDDNPQYFDGKTSPFLFLLPVFAFFGISRDSRQQRNEKLLMLLFSALFLLYACAQASIRIRYFSPILPPLVILSLFGIYNLRSIVLGRIFRLSEPVKKIVIFGITFAILGLNVCYMIDRFEKDRPLDYITGKITRDEYIQAFRPEYATFKYANKNLSANDKIFGLFLGNRGYYSDIQIEFGIDLFDLCLTQPENGKHLAEALVQKGFSHILMNFKMFNHLVKKISAQNKMILKDFFDKHTAKVFTKDGYGLLKINL